MGRTYYGSTGATATSIHAATNELSFDTAASAGGTVGSGNIAPGASPLAFAFTTPANEPNNAAWPSGTYQVQLDCNAAGANITYGFKTIVGASGHFARVNSGLTGDLETFASTSTDFSGTGLKLALATTWVPTAGSASDRFEGLLGANNSVAHGNQSFTLVFDSDFFMNGPWPETDYRTAEAGIFFVQNRRGY